MNHLSLSQASKLIEFKNHKGILGITNGGGGGHQKAMEAVYSLFEKENSCQSKSFTIVDIFRDSFPANLGKVIYRKINNSWNKAKKEGDIKKQEFLVKGKCFKKGPSNQQLAEIVFFIPIFISSFFRLFFNKKITLVVDTQPIGTKAIIRAIRLINFIFDRNIIFKKVLTDFPTSYATHYASSLKNLSNKDKKFLEVITTKPLIEDNASESEWWKKNFGLNFDPKNPRNNHVKYMEFPLRPAFKEWQNKEVKGNHSQIQIKINNDEEFEMISTSVKNEKKKLFSKEIVNIPIDDKDFIGIFTLGSQASKKTKEYANTLIENMQAYSKNNPDRKFYFFFACGEHKEKAIDLFKQIHELNKKIPKSLKEKFHIIPIGFQDDEELAPLIHRADIGIYSSGGITCMEVLTTAKGRVLLHSDIHLKNQNFDNLNAKLLEGIALWEKGNAQYLIKEKNATMTAPGACFQKHLENLLN